MKMYYDIFGRTHWIRVPNKDIELIKEIFNMVDNRLGENVITNIILEDIFNGKEEN